MNKNTLFKAAAVAGAAVMMLSGCGSSNNASGGKTEALDENAKVEISFAGWSLDTTPEFQTLADGFMKDHPNITVKVKQYSADDYDKQLTSDISGKSQPDVFPIKNLQKYYTYAAESGGLADLSDIAASYDGDKNIDVSSYKLEDGKYYAMPYR
ncbi:extracellular solute-binding protein [Bifidobacterium sp. 82T10]|uniref:Extracellular solute-binding protein n=1 Tax=Bifidobacterium miconis TaxID=2834435 RepID=A0ABS6WGY5_9BIFI|nr:extracellular solute-binding protein [Bifidobacterium miconis]